MLHVLAALVVGVQAQAVGLAIDGLADLLRARAGPLRGGYGFALVELALAGDEAEKDYDNPLN